MTSDDRPVEGENPRVTPERVRELADQGLGRNAIIRATGATRHAVDKAAEQAGVTWDRSMTREATAAAMADAAQERLDLGTQFREVARVILTDVLTGDHRDRPIHELKDMLWAAGSAAASDARLGELALREAQHNSLHGDDSEAKEQFGALLESIRSGFQVLDEMPYEELDPTGEFEDLGTGGYDDQDNEDDTPGWE